MNLSAAPDDGQVTLSWANPANNTITKYQYRRKTDTGTYGSWTDIPNSGDTTTSYTVTGLTNGTQYTFAVRAVNAGGNGAESTVTATPALAPTAPTNLEAEVGDRRIGLTWDDPGDSTIDEYEYSTDGGTFSVISGSDDTTTSYTVTGLTNGTQYTFAVRAVNAVGNGAESSVTAKPLWPAPTGLVATAGQGRVTVEWNNGHDDIDDYYIYVYEDGVRRNTIFLPPGSGSTTTRTVYPLTNGTLYDFSVRALNGKESPTVTARPVSMPAPDNLTATEGDDRQTTLSWSDPGDDSIYKYQVSIDNGTTFTDISDSSKSTTTTTVTGLTNGTGYTLAVRGVNWWGYGAASTATATPLWPAPTNLVATPDSSRVFLEWDRNPGITDYRVDVSDGSSVSVSAGSGSKTIAAIDSLANGTAYTFTVLATHDSAQGSADSSWPATVDATPMVVSPDAPTNLSATPSNSQATLSWDDPGNNTITKYQVSEDGGTTFADISDSGASTTTTTVTGLLNGTLYTFAVLAENASGRGPASTTTATPVNDAPTASAKTVSTDEDTAYTFKGADFGFTSVKSGATLNHMKITALPGADKGTLSVGGTAITGVTTPRQVTKTGLDAGNLTYTPPANANGAAFATFAFKVNDGVADSELAYTITIDVNAVNDPLTGSDKTVFMDEDTTYTFGEADFGFSDVDGDTLDHVKITALPGTDRGTLSFNGTDITDLNTAPQVTFSATDEFRYTPPANANGAAFATFDFKVNDGELDSAASYTITINVNAVNDPPEAKADTAETSEDIPIVIGVLENDSDVDAGTILRVVEVGLPGTGPSSGTAEINTNGTTVTYTPDAGFTGTDMFRYAVTDGIVTTDSPVSVAILESGSNANLLNLTVSPGTLTPDFAATTTSYAVAVEASTDSVKVTPTTAEVGATVTVNGREVARGSASDAIALALGAVTAITVKVIAADRTTTQTYTIQIRRAAEQTRPRPEDVTRPTVAITTGAAAPVTGAFTVTITFSEAVTGLEQQEITVTNGSVTGFTGSGTSYTAEITPSEDGEVTVEVGSNAARDRAGNGNRAAEPLVIEADLTRPEVEITSEATGTAGGAFEVTITFSEAVTGFEQSEIEVTNGTVSSFSGSGTSYTAEITPSANGAVTVEVTADVAVDGAGNGNRAAEPFVIVADLERPEVTIEGPTEPVGLAGFEVTITFSEPVEGFEPEDIQVSNGMVADFTEVSSSEYRATIKPAEAGQVVVVEVPEDVAEDGAGNGNQAAEAFEVEAKLVVSYENQSYMATEGGDAVTVTVKLSQAGGAALTIPIRVTQPEATEDGDYTVEGLEDWDTEGEGVGTLTFAAQEAEQTFRISANHDGDGDDETVELGFGVLPEIVMAGDPAVAMVTLEDKGLVELKVSFGQAGYTAKEGQAADIKVTVSPAADRRIEVPLVVTLQGGATPEDYSGVPGSMVFEEGGSDGTISVKVLADEFNDPGEEIVLSLGRLPEAVSAGDPSLTLLQFVQQRTAEQFSRSLEGMLAVIARTTAVSAQTAIEGRFERHRQWGRLGSSDGARPAPPPGSGNGAAALPQGGSERMDRERAGDGGADGSAVQSAGRAAPTVPATGSGDISGMRDRELNPSGVSFEMSLGESERETSWAPVLWGQGDLQHFNGDVAQLGMDYRGGLEAAHVGLDLFANDRMLAGLSIMRSWGDMEYTDDGTEGVLESRMGTVHPYLYWQPNERLSVWGIGGLGGGQVDVEEPGRTHDFDADFRMFAGGVRAVLSKRGNNEWGLRADGFATQLGTDASEDIAKVSGGAQRGRLMLEWVHNRELTVGRSLSLKAEAGGRIDEGDADRGAGVETGFRLAYLDANRGLDVALHGRVLAVHESDYRDWGVGLQASWDPGEKQRGFRASVMSSWGQDGGGRTTLWDNADAVMRPAGMDALEIGSQYRMETEVAYAGLKAPGLAGLLTPYSRLRWAGQGRELALGTAWSLPIRLQQALPSMLEVEAIRRENGTGPADRAVLARMSIPF